jgi:hypothetical protein
VINRIPVAVPVTASQVYVGAALQFDYTVSDDDIDDGILQSLSADYRFDTEATWIPNADAANLQILVQPAVYEDVPSRKTLGTHHVYLRYFDGLEYSAEVAFEYRLQRASFTRSTLEFIEIKSTDVAVPVDVQFTLGPHGLPTGVIEAYFDADTVNVEAMSPSLATSAVNSGLITWQLTDFIGVHGRDAPGVHKIYYKFDGVVPKVEFMRYRINSLPTIVLALGQEFNFTGDPQTITFTAADFDAVTGQEERQTITIFCKIDTDAWPVTGVPDVGSITIPSLELQAHSTVGAHKVYLCAFDGLEFSTIEEVDYFVLPIDLSSDDTTGGSSDDGSTGAGGSTNAETTTDGSPGLGGGAIAGITIAAIAVAAVAGVAAWWFLFKNKKQADVEDEAAGDQSPNAGTVAADEAVPAGDAVGSD